jgi:predicted Zn-dependent peptidase
MAPNPAKRATAKTAAAKQATAKRAGSKSAANPAAKRVAQPAPARPTTRPPIGRLVAPTAPRLLEASLPGGIHALVVRRPAVPLVEVRLAVPLAADQIRKPAPVSILSRSLFAGTDRHDRMALAGAIEDLGASLDAHVGEDRVILSGAVLAEHLKELLALLVEVITSASYPPDEVKADRNRAADETLIALSQPDVVAAQALRRRLFGTHPYATPIPTPAALHRVDAAALHALHPVVLNPAGAHLVLVGDLQPNRAVRLAEEAMAAWTVTDEAPPAELPPVTAPRPGPLDLVPRPASVQSNLRIGGSFARLGEPDWPAASLAEQILSGMFSSRIVANIRERNGYSYSPRSFVRHGRAGSSFTMAADVATGVTGPALVEIFYELGRIATLGINEEELEMARRHSVGRFSFDTASLPGLATTLANLAIRGVDLGFLTAYPKAVIAATKQMVDEAAARYLAPSRLVTVVVGDPDVVTGPLSALGEVALRS